MAGALFVVTIPTEDDEKRLQEKSRGDPRAEISNSMPVLSKSKTKEKPNTPNSKSVGINYGTFQQMSPSMVTTPKIFKTSVDKVNEKDTADEKVKGDLKHKKQIDANFAEEQKPLRKSWEGLKDIMSTRREQNPKKKDNDQEINLSMDASMEVVLKEILKKFKIENSTWTKSNNGRSYQVIFTVEYNQKYEKLLHKFNEWGIGDREGSTVSILHCTAFHTHPKGIEVDEDQDAAELSAQKQSAWNRFMNSLTARLNVARIVKDVRQEATITFDFVVLVVSAAILASFGLVENSTIFLASSMLISPLMGPIIAAIFGTAIKDNSLQSLGIINELWGIAMATIVGFLFGLIICSIDERYIGEGLTIEMSSRGELHSLFVGILTAIPSGAAAAVAILGGNIGSLVGVAISASILPPAVNAGVLWALACIFLFFEKDGTRFNTIITSSIYSDYQAAELAVFGTISMCVTITNVICVYIMGVLVLKIKEIAPIVSSSRQFWKHDIKIAREINKNYYGDDSVIANEIAALPQEDKDVLGFNPDLLRSIDIERSSYQNTWSPMGTRYPLTFVESRPTIQDLECIYMTMTHPPEPTKYSRGNINVSLNCMFPQKYSVISDHLAAYRRGSMPVDTLKSPKLPRSALNVNYGKEPLQKISENQTLPETSENSKNESKSNERKKSRKFTITPATENL